MRKKKRQKEVIPSEQPQPRRKKLPKPNEANKVLQAHELFGSTGVVKDLDQQRRNAELLNEQRHKQPYLNQKRKEGVKRLTPHLPRFSKAAMVKHMFVIRK